MTMIEKLVGNLEDKRRWKDYRARVKELPQAHRTAIEGIERYLSYYGQISDGTVLMTMLHDLLALFETNAADRGGIAAIVGDDPVAFAEGFVDNYTEGQWINKERRRLTASIDAALREEAAAGGDPTQP